MPEYIRFNFQTRKLGLKESNIRIYPLPCMHVGAPQCDMEFLEAHVERIEDDPNARVVYAGDGGECVVVGSKGDIFKQTMSPQGQMDTLVELLEPIREKLLFGIRGNHGHRVYKQTGLEFDANLCYRLGIPYLGVAVFANVLVNRSSYDLYFHHGSDSGTSTKAKITKAENFGRFINADAIITAHSHVAIEMVPAPLLEADNDTGRVKTKQRHQYICGSAYDSRSGYAEEKGYSPLLPQYLSIEFDGRIVEGHAKYGQKSTIFRADGKREITGG